MIVLRRLAKLKGVKLMFEKLKKGLSGKKSISVIVGMIITGIIDGYLRNAHGFSVPQEVWIFLFGLLGITYKAGANRVEGATKELLDAIKEQNELIKKQK